ncbi:TlpA family protein disulfide reductase [Effusibacillus pohliae]|uniref:TlpA family protein disulfide reductase n=1 Tax=Effusibacillus pohliae TaxID=232270 RepID=UPI0003691E74|nr:TlpA disulfide reductase family protein [Effusibacillus pohliae]
MKNWQIGVGALVIVGLAICAIFGNAGSNTTAPNSSAGTAATGQPSTEQKAELPLPGYQAPDFTLTDMNGKTVKLSDFRGKPILVNFWASWCPPCRAEMPDLVKKSEQYGDKVIFLGVNMTTSEQDPEGPKKFLKEFHVKYQNLLDDKAKVAELYQAVGIPTTVTIDPKGIVVDRFQGMMNESTMERAIQKLLKK